MFSEKVIWEIPVKTIEVSLRVSPTPTTLEFVFYFKFTLKGEIMKKILGAILLTAVILWPLACGKNIAPTTSGPVTVVEVVPTGTITPTPTNISTVTVTPTATLTPIPGLTWTARTLPRSQNWSSVTYGNGVFVAVAYGSAVAATSPDGINWTEQSLPSSQSWISVTYGNGVFVAVAYGSAVAATSLDGITWTARTLPSSQSWYSVTYGNGVFVAVANGTAVAATSPDGINWTTQTLPSSQSWLSVTYGNGEFVAVAYNSAVAATSLGRDHLDGPHPPQFTVVAFSDLREWGVCGGCLW